MLRKLQQRSTFSCTDRTREREKKGNGGERRRDERTNVTVEHRGMRGRAADPALECHAPVSGLRVFLCVCTCVCSRIRQGSV